jgi:hypothetical protein
LVAAARGGSGASGAGSILGAPLPSFTAMSSLQMARSAQKLRLDKGSVLVLPGLPAGPTGAAS